MQDHEKWIKKTFSEERIPLDTHALFQELKQHIPQKKKRYGFVWILLLPVLFTAGYLLFSTDNDKYTNGHDDSRTITSSGIIAGNLLEKDNGSSPKAELPSSISMLENSIEESQENGLTKKSIETKEANPSPLQQAGNNIVTSNTSKPVHTKLNLAKEESITLEMLTPNDKQLTTIITHGEVKSSSQTPINTAQIQGGTSNEETTPQSNISAQNEVILDMSMEYSKVHNNSVSSSFLAQCEPTQLKWNYDLGHPLIHADKMTKNFITIWAQASTTSGTAKHNSESDLVNTLYRDIAKSQPGYQFDLGTSIRLSDHIRLKTSVFYRSIVQSLSHNYVVRTSTEQEGIKQLIIDKNGQSNSTNGMIELVELHQFEGTWFQFLNQSGVNIDLSYAKTISPRSEVQLGLGLSTSLLSQNTGSYITEELTIDAFEENSFKWNTAISLQPNLGYSYAINRKLKAAFQLQYYNTQTTFYNQELSYHMFNIGLNCSYKL